MFDAWFVVVFCSCPDFWSGLDEVSGSGVEFEVEVCCVVDPMFESGVVCEVVPGVESGVAFGSSVAFGSGVAFGSDDGFLDVEERFRFPP